MLRAEHDTPEIARTDLSPLLLTLRAMKIAHLEDLDWLDAPPEEAVQSAELLLDRIGANGGMKQRLARFPLPVDVARQTAALFDRHPRV